MNDRERHSRSLVVRRTGWMCAGLAAATGLYNFCGPNFGLRAAGVPADASRETGRQSVDVAEHDEVERALFEADPAVPKSSTIQRVAVGWPLKKKPATATTSIKATRPKLLLWASEQRDPFAEADDAAQKKILGEQASSSAEIAGETGFTKSTSNRRRLLEFQGGTPGTATADEKPTDTTGKVSVHEVTESKTEINTRVPKLTATNPAAESESEAELRAMFEERPAAEEPIGRATVQTATNAPAKVKAASATVPESKSESAQAAQRVSASKTGQSSTAAHAGEDTPLPVEALMLRAQKSQPRQAQVTSQKLKLAADQVEEPAADGTPATEESTIPTLVEPQDTGDQGTGDEVAGEPQATESTPAAKPEADIEQPARVRVDQVPMTSKSASLSMKVVPPKKAPAKIGEAQPMEPSDTAPVPHPVSEPPESVEPVIRPSPKTELPPVQVLANRPIELPAPEGWSAAVKLNARRKARLASLTGQPATESAWPTNTKAGQASTEVEGRSSNVAEQQSYRVGSKSPVSLDRIEDEKGVRMLGADDADLAPVRDAHHRVEPKLISEEPEMIREAAPEPIVIAEYAAHGQSAWWMRIFTALGVLFGLYGLWCCRLRSTDADARV